MRRLTVSLLAALAISAVCTYGLGRHLTVDAARRLPTRFYVAPARPLASGELLKPEDLQLLSWPASEPLDGAFDKVDALTGRIVLYPIGTGQPLTDKLVSAAGAGTGLAARIPDGMRAIALKSDDVVGVAGFLAPGSHLDVLVTYRTDKQPEPTTLTVLENAEVLAAGHQIQPDPEGKPANVTVVTLLLSPGDAERVVLASTQGTIHFVLRSGSDKATLAQRPISLSQLSPVTPAQDLQSPAPGWNAPHRPARKAARAAPAMIVVQTVLGEKQTSTAFPKAGER